MKNLKKVLALVLVVAMMASFAVSASAASFTDSSDIDYKTAVDLLSDLDVIEGFTDGSFDPEGNVTRAQVAKMIAYIMNGGEDASSTFAASASFSDVASTYWAANSIGYCAAQEIVAGAGDNMYYPNNDVTGVQLAKMALVALGYDPTIEGLEGSSWSINTINLADSAGLFDGLNSDFNASAAASRQEAAQILYNMMLSEMVCYTDNGTNIIIGDITINTDATRKYMNSDGEGVDDKDLAELAIEEYYDLTGTGAVQDGFDDYGRPARIINIRGIDSITIPDDADLSYEGQVEAGDLYSDLGSGIRDYDQIVVIDGDTVYDETNSDDEGDADYEMVIARSDDTNNSYKGATMEVYIDDDAEELTFVIVNTYLAQVNSIDENSDDETLLDIDFEVFGGDSRVLDEQDSFAYEEDDYVLVTLGNDDTIDVIGAPETIEGTASRIGSDYYTIDGTQYDWSEKYDEDAVGTDNTGTYTFYLDTQGNIIGSTEIEAGATAGNYLYVNASEASVDSFDSYVRVRVTFTDGTDGTVYLQTRERSGQDQYRDTDGDWVDLTDDLDGDDVIAEGWYSYTVNSSDDYYIRDIDSDYVLATTVAIEDLLSGNAGVGNNKVANTSTRLYLIDSDITYTGYRNFPDPEDLDAYVDESSEVPVLYVLSSRNGRTASEIYVMNDGGTSESVTIAMYTGDSYTSSDGDYATFYVDGEEQDFLMNTSTDSLTEDAIYALDGNSSDGYDASVITEEEYDSTFGNYEVVIGRVVDNDTDSAFYLDDDVDYDDIAGDDIIDVPDGEDDVLFYYGYDEDDEVLQIYDGSDGSSDSLSRNDIVKVVYITDGSSNYALAAYIMD